MYINLKFIYVYINIHISVSEIVGLALQFATQNCLGYYSKLNLGSKFLAEMAIHFPHIKLRILYTLKVIL